MAAAPADGHFSRKNSPRTRNASTLLTPFALGPMTLPNRVVMAPLTRARAGRHGITSTLAAEYYRQRAGAGGAIIAAGGHTAGTGTARIDRDEADLIAYGELFIANPDLPARFAAGAPLARARRATFYGGGAEGYTDYPRWAGWQQRCPGAGTAGASVAA